MCLQTMQKEAQANVDKLFTRLESGEESETPGLLEQWLKEGKMTEQEALNEAVGTFVVGIDTVLIVMAIVSAYTKFHFL